MTIAKSCSGRGMCALTTFLFQPTTCAVLASFLTRLRTPYQLFIGHPFLSSVCLAWLEYVSAGMPARSYCIPSFTHFLDFSRINTFSETCIRLLSKCRLNQDWDDAL